MSVFYTTECNEAQDFECHMDWSIALNQRDLLGHVSLKITLTLMTISFTDMDIVFCISDYAPNVFCKTCVAVNGSIILKLFVQILWLDLAWSLYYLNAPCPLQENRKQALLCIESVYCKFDNLILCVHNKSKQPLRHLLIPMLGLLFYFRTMHLLPSA